MSSDFNELMGNSISEAGKGGVFDHFMIGKKYFSCGHSNKSYYNHAYAVAIAIIGKRYGSNSGNNSNYHKGIAYIAKELGISKQQVKSLRKKYKAHRRYEFKTPYVIPDIVKKIISLLQELEDDQLVQDMIGFYKELLYRELLIKEQYNEIKNAASALKRKEVLEVEGKLDHLTQTFRG